MLSLAEICDIPFPMLKVEVLTLETMIVPSVIPGIAKLLQNSPGVKLLKLDIVNSNIVPVFLPWTSSLIPTVHYIIIQKPRPFTFLFLIHIDKESLNFKVCMKHFYVLQDADLNYYLDLKDLDQNQCWKPKDLDFSTSFQPKLMTSFMEFLLENTREDNISQYNWQLSWL